MSEEKMRAEFEAAAEEHFWLQDLRGDYDKAEQEYLDEIVQTAWEFWQLSREALVIELPESYPRHRDSYIDVMDAELVVEAIEAAVVRAKP